MKLNDNDYVLGSLAGVATVVPTSDGDILIGLRAAGAHPDDEAGVVRIEVDSEGVFAVAVLTPDGHVIVSTTVQRHDNGDVGYAITQSR